MDSGRPPIPPIYQNSHIFPFFWGGASLIPSCLGCSCSWIWRLLWRHCARLSRSSYLQWGFQVRVFDTKVLVVAHFIYYSVWLSLSCDEYLRHLPMWILTFDIPLHMLDFRCICACTFTPTPPLLMTWSLNLYSLRQHLAVCQRWSLYTRYEVCVFQDNPYTRIVSNQIKYLETVYQAQL